MVRALILGGRVLRVSLAILLVSVVSSCVVPSRTLRPNEALKPSAPEGYVAVVADVPDAASVLASICQDGDLSRCVTVGPQTNADGVRVLAMPPGRYCVGEIAFDQGMQSMHLQLEPEHMRCFDVVTNTVVYPGHLAVRIVELESATSFVSYDFRPIAGVEERTRTSYPAVAAVPFNTVEVTPLIAPK